MTSEFSRTYHIRVSWDEGCAGWAAEVWKPHWVMNFPPISIARWGPFRSKEEADEWAKDKAEKHLARGEDDVYSYTYVAGEHEEDSESDVSPTRPTLAQRLGRGRLW